MAGGDLQRAARRIVDILERLFRRRQPRQHIGHGGVQQLAFVGERQAAGVTLEQRRGDFLFQGADLAADRRLAEREHLAGMGEAARRCHRVKDAKLVPVHLVPPCHGALGCERQIIPTCPPARKRSASSAAMQPMPAAVTAWRNILSLTSPGREHARNAGVRGIGRRLDIAALVHLQLAIEQLGRRRMADGDEQSVHGQFVQSNR